MVQDYMQQMLQNPRQFESVVNTPYMQSMLQMLSSNPAMSRLVVESNPQLASNPELREQVIRSLPAMMQQLQNPDMRALLTNSEALQAIMQIQQGFQRLQTAAPPEVLARLGFSGIPTMPMPQPPAPSATTTTNTTTTTTTTGQTPASQPGRNPLLGGPSANYFSQMLNMMANNTINQPPEQRFAAQLEQLASMGFINRDANIQGKSVFSIVAFYMT